MVLIKLGYSKGETYGWKLLPADYEGEEYNGFQVVTIHEKLWEKVKNIKKYQKKGWDSVVLIDGPRRGGKSTLGKQVAYLINPEGTIDNFVAGLEEAPEKISKAKFDDYLFFDEGSLVANSKQAMSKKNVQLEQIIDVCGVKRLVLIFCMPSFFSISKSIAVEHSRFLLHVYTGKKLERGKFTYFGTKKKRLLYSLGKKNFGSYKKPKADWNGKFVDFTLPFEEDYIKLKAASLQEALGNSKETEKPKKEIDYKREFVARFKENNPDVTDKDIAKGFGISRSEYYRRRAAWRAAKTP